MNTYYISSSGCDENSGISPENAWKTLKNIKEYVKGGDTVKLRCGDVFYGRLEIPSSSAKENRTVATSFGEGRKPRITRYKIAKGDVWEAEGGNIWRLDFGRCSGDDSSDASNTGFIRVCGENRGFKMFDKSKLKKQWDFFSSESGVFVYSEKNPSEICDKIYIGAAGGAVSLGDNCIICGVEIFGGGTHGITGTVENAEIADCDIHDFGGSHLKTDPRENIRFGNGIELWSGGKNILIEGCKIYGIYDVAFTMQGFPKVGWENVVFKNNIVYGCQQSFEIWTQSSEGGYGMKNCVFENNICLDAGYCWSYDARPDKENACHLLLYALGCDSHGIRLRNNVFFNPRKSLYYSKTGEIPLSYKSDENTVYLYNGAKLINPNAVMADKDFFEVYQNEKNSKIIYQKRRGEFFPESI